MVIMTTTGGIVEGGLVDYAANYILFTQYCTNFGDLTLYDAPCIEMINTVAIYVVFLPSRIFNHGD